MLRDRRRPGLVRLALVLAIVVAVVLPSGGCWDHRELEDVAFILALGLDKGENAPIKYTVQIAVPALLAPGRSAGGPGVLTETIEGDSLPEVTNALSTFRHKQVSLEHNAIVVIGKELAQEGVLERLGELVRNREFRRTDFLLVSTGTAAEILQALQTERNPAAAIEELVRLAAYTGLAPVMTVHDWLTTYEASGEECIAPIVGSPRDVSASGLGVGAESGGASPSGGAGVGQGHSSGDGEVSPSKVQVMGTAVFRGDRLVDFLSGRETQALLLMRGLMKRTVLTFPMEEPPATVSVTIKGEQPRKQVKLENGIPLIKERLIFEGDIDTFIYRGKFLTNESDLEEVSHQMSLSVKRTADELVARMKELGTDVFGFGLAIRRQMPDFQSWLDFNWPAYFQRAEFDIEVKSFVRRTGSTISPLPELPIYRPGVEPGGEGAGGTSGGGGT